jgi:SAM-dependent methyltransferase
MLAVARANLNRAGISDAQVRLAEIRNLPFSENSFDLITIHQVLHYIDDPEHAVAEAARVLRPGGRLLVVDFAPHDLEFLREGHAHRRLGFSRQTMSQWLEGPGLSVETVLDLAPPHGAAKGLTVTLWLARDRRIQMAAPSGAAPREVA